MKRKYLFLSLMALALTACNASKEDPETVVGHFLDAYLTIDYQKAAGYCDADAAAFLLDSVEEFDNLPEEIRTEMRNQAQAITPSILGVQQLGRDSVKVQYCLRLDSLHHADGQMILTRNEDKTWLIQSW